MEKAAQTILRGLRISEENVYGAQGALAWGSGGP
jgi:hypothetical protein